MQSITNEDFQGLVDRVNRLQKNIDTKTSLGYTNKFTLDDGKEHTYTFVGIKSPEQLGDEIITIFVWIWSMKDYLKEIVIKNGGNPNSIEEIVNSEMPLRIVADIANKGKHGILKKSRSGKFPCLCNVGITIPSACLNSISVGAFSVDLSIKNAEAAELHASIAFEKEGFLEIDAFDVIRNAIKSWEELAFPVAGILMQK